MAVGKLAQPQAKIWEPCFAAMLSQANTVSCRVPHPAAQSFDRFCGLNRPGLVFAEPVARDQPEGLAEQNGEWGCAALNLPPR